MLLRTSMLLALAAASAAPPPSALTMPTFIASHMALQRAPLAANVWGWAPAGAAVSVSLDGKVVATAKAAAADGLWVAALPPQPAGNDHTISLSDGKTNVVLSDIAFGDVYLCSGQSNMQFSVNTAFNASAEIADSVNYPNLRLATVAMVVSDTPMPDAPSKAKNYSWARSAPDAFIGVGDGPFTYISAACYFFGRSVYTSLGGKVPIGLVGSDWGGQRVECFSSPDALKDATCGGTVPADGGIQRPADGSRRLASALEAAEPLEPTIGGAISAEQQLYYYRGMRPADEPNPAAGQIWNAMIYPLLRMRFAGAVWYQGEANANDPSGYACRFPAMIADWRAKFALPSLSFVYVQLAAYPDQDYSLIRAAQDAALQLPLTAAALAIDLGDPPGPYGSIHPRRKQEVGRRLALATRAIKYGDVGGPWKGPAFTGAQLTSDGGAFGAVLGFEAGTAYNLHLAGTAACVACCTVSPFEVMHADGKWVRAPAVVSDGTIVLSSSAAMVGVRLQWEGYPQCTVYNGVGGPDDHTGLAAAPFTWCAWGFAGGAPVWSGAPCVAVDPSAIPYSPRGAAVPSALFADWSMGGGASDAAGPKDAATSGTNFRSGNPGGVGVITSKHALLGEGKMLDSLALDFRYIAGYTPKAGEEKKGSTLSVLLVDDAGDALRTLYTSPPLTNYSYDAFKGYSPPVHVRTSGIKLNATTSAKAYVALRIENNERNLQLPLDDLVGGMNVSVTWCCEG